MVPSTLPSTSHLHEAKWVGHLRRLHSAPHSSCPNNPHVAIPLSCEGTTTGPPISSLVWCTHSLSQLNSRATSPSGDKVAVPCKKKKGKEGATEEILGGERRWIADGWRMAQHRNNVRPGRVDEARTQVRFSGAV